MTRAIDYFIRGIGSLVDILPSPKSGRVGRLVPHRSDADAIGSDWLCVGNDLRQAINSAADDLSSDDKTK